MQLSTIQRRYAKSEAKGQQCISCTSHVVQLTLIGDYSKINRQIKHQEAEEKGSKTREEKGNAKRFGSRFHFFPMKMRGFAGLLPISGHSKSLTCGSPIPRGSFRHNPAVCDRKKTSLQRLQKIASNFLVDSLFSIIQSSDSTLKATSFLDSMVEYCAQHRQATLSPRLTN